MNRGVCSRKGRLGKRDAIEVPRGTDGEIALPQRNIEGSPFRIGTAGSPQWPRTSRRSLPASLHFPSSRKGPELVSTSDDPGDSQTASAGAHRQAGMHHAVLPRQAQIHRAAQRASDFPARHAQSQADVPLLQLPAGRAAPGRNRSGRS